MKIVKSRIFKNYLNRSKVRVQFRFYLGGRHISAIRLPVFLTQIISFQQKMSMRKLYNQFQVGKNGIHVSNFQKKCIFPNIQYLRTYGSYEWILQQILRL